MLYLSLLGREHNIVYSTASPYLASMANNIINNARPKPHITFFFFSTTLFVCFFHGKSSWLKNQANEVVMVQSRRQDSHRRCDLSVGKWVYDQSYPLYDSNCPYLSTAVTCQRNGRPDSGYEKWKWKPNGCSLPRYVPVGTSLKKKSL